VDHFDVDGRGHAWPQATGACRNGQLGKCITESVQDFNGLDCRFTAGLRYLPSDRSCSFVSAYPHGWVRNLRDGKPCRLWVTDKPNGEGATLLSLTVSTEWQ
jgi:hypothetical protein